MFIKIQGRFYNTRFFETIDIVTYKLEHIVNGALRDEDVIKKPYEIRINNGVATARGYTFYYEKEVDRDTDLSKILGAENGTN